MIVLIIFLFLLLQLLLHPFVQTASIEKKPPPSEYSQLLSRVCKSLPQDERRRRKIHEQSRWRKQNYFNIIKNITMPWCLTCLNTTSKTYPQSPMDSLLLKQKLCQPNIKRKQKWLFFGDSITGEVAFGLEKVLNMRRYEFVRSHNYKELPVSKFHNLSARIKSEKANFFVFDSSILHRNFRKYNTFDDAQVITQPMYRYIEGILKPFNQLAVKHQNTTKMFWVGTPNVDAWIQNSHPRKNDSHTFYELHYVDMWQSIERELLRKVCSHIMIHLSPPSLLL